MRIYVGATFSRYEEVRVIIDALTAAGYEVTHDWTRTDAFGPDGHPLPATAGGYKLAQEDGLRHAEDDYFAVLRSEALLFLGQEASCGWPVELGMALALNRAPDGPGVRQVYVVAPFKYTVFWDLPDVRVFGSVEEACAMLGVQL